MELLLRLWKESLKRVLPAALLLIAASVALFFLFRCYSLTALFVPKRLAQLRPDAMEGAWVSDEIGGIYAAFARETVYRGEEPVDVRGVWYVIDLDAEHYMALLVRGGKLEETEALLAACDEKYLNGLDWMPMSPVRVSGTIRAMDAAARELYYASAGEDASVKRSMLPYYLDEGRLNGYHPAVLWVALVLSVAMLGLGVAAIVWTVTWGGQKKLLAKASSLGELPKMVQKLERFYNETFPVGGVWMNALYILFQDGPISVLCRPWDVAWVYRKPVLFTRGTWSVVTFRMMDGTRHRKMMGTYDARSLMYTMLETAPGIEQGWSRETELAYRQDRESFVKNWNRYRPGYTRSL